MIVLDTNVLVSAFLTEKSPPFYIVEAIAGGKVQLAASDEMLEEYSEVLRSNKKWRISEEEMIVFLELLRENVYQPVSLPEHRCSLPDVSDEPFATCAYGAGVLLVTGNGAHFTPVDDRIKILTPREYYDLYLC